MNDFEVFDGWYAVFLAGGGWEMHCVRDGRRVASVHEPGTHRAVCPPEREDVDYYDLGDVWGRDGVGGAAAGAVVP